MIKKVAISLLLFAFVFQYSGSLLVFRLSLFSHYDDVKKELRRTKHFTIITLSKKEFQHYKVPHKKEICMEGAMYDYDKQEWLADSVKLYCVRDYKEEFLLAKFFKQLHKQTDRQQRETAKNNLLNLLTSIYALPDDKDETQPVSSGFLCYTYFSEDIAQGFFSFHSPPPKSNLSFII